MKAEQALKREERRRRREDNDRIITQMEQGGNKYLTDALFTDAAMQKELAMSKLKKDPKHPKKLLDTRWGGKKASLIDPTADRYKFTNYTHRGTHRGSDTRLIPGSRFYCFTVSLFHLFYTVSLFTYNYSANILRSVFQSIGADNAKRQVCLEEARGIL